MPSIADIRSWLNVNKVFFEVVAAIAIGLTSLTVSILAFRVSERTLVATEVAALPHFAISKRARMESNGKFVEETMALNNHGAPVYNVAWKVRTFLAFENYTPKPSVTYIPLVGYYYSQFPTASPTGELSSIVGHENMRKFSILYEEALARKVTDVTTSYYPSIVTISAVSYEDRLGRSSTTYFKGSTKVNEAEVAELFTFGDKTRGVDIDKANLDSVIAAAHDTGWTIPRSK